MKKCLFLLFVIMTGFSTFVQAQSKVTRKPQRVTHKHSAQKQNSRNSEAKHVYSDVVEEQPQYPGGVNGLMSYLNKNVKYPKEAAENGIQGRVVVAFTVERDGSVSEPTVVKSVDPSLDMEAVRVVSGMPKWTPGKQNGQPVRCKITIPVQFSLQ